MITATQQGPRQFDTPVSFKNYQIPSKPISAARVKLRAKNFGLNELLEAGEYVCDVRQIVNANNWEKLCEFHEIIKQNHNTFDETEQKEEIDAALHHLRPNLYQWLIDLKDKEESKVKKKQLTKGFIYQVLSLDYSFAEQCARTSTEPHSPFLSKFNWRNLTKTSEVESYNPSIKLQYEPLPKSDITILREELEESDSETSVSDTELEERDPLTLEAERENMTRKRQSRCSTGDTPNSAPASKKRRAQIIETDSDSDSDADNALVKRGNGKGIETDADNFTASDTRSLLATLNEKQPAGQTSRPISPQVPAIVIKRQKIHEVVELDEDVDVDQLLEQAIDKKPSIVKSPADTSKPSASVKKWLVSKVGLKEELKELMELNGSMGVNELNEVNESLWNSIIELSEFVQLQADAIKLYQNHVKIYGMHSQVPYFKNVGENEQLLKKYNYALEQLMILHIKYQELRADHDELEAEDNEVCTALDIDMQDLMAQVSKAEEDLEVFKKETIEAQEKVKRLELQTEVEKRQKLQKNYVELFKKYQSAKQTVQQSEKAHSKLNADLKLIHKKWKEDIKRRKNAEDKVNELKLEVEKLKKNVIRIHSEIYDKQVAYSTAEKELNLTETVLTKANEKAQAEISHLKEQNEKLQKRSETLENENSHLKSELERMRNTFNPRFYNS